MKSNVETVLARGRIYAFELAGELASPVFSLEECDAVLSEVARS